MTACLRPYEIFRGLRPGERTDAGLLEQILIDLGVNHAEFAGHEEFPEAILRRELGLRIWQLPCQLAAYLAFLAGPAGPIRSYVELGARWGGTFYVVDSFLRALRPDFGRSVALDLDVRPPGWDDYHARFPSATFVSADSRDWDPAGRFDLAFIDADHAYENVMADYRRARTYSRWLGFHDIVSDVCPDVPRAWAEVARAHPRHYEFVAQYPGFRNVMGIGLVEVDAGPDPDRGGAP